MEPTIGIFKHSPDFKTVKPGEIVFREGDPGDLMYVILSGEIEITFRGKTVETLKEGQIFGELALVDDRPRSATATAKSDARIVPVDEKRFTFLVEETPYFAVQVMRIMAARIRMMLALV